MLQILFYFILTKSSTCVLNYCTSCICFQAAISYKDRTTFYKQMQECEKKRIPIAVMLGKQEIEQGVVKIRNVETRKETFVKRGNLIQELKNVLN